MISLAENTGAAPTISRGRPVGQSGASAATTVIERNWRSIADRARVCEIDRTAPITVVAAEARIEPTGRPREMSGRARVSARRSWLRSKLSDGRERCPRLDRQGGFRSRC